MSGIRLLVVWMAAAGLWGIQTASAQGQAAGQSQSPAVARQDKDPSPDEIIRKFSAKETEFYEAWMQYTYHQVAEVKVLSVNGVPKGEVMTTISDIVFKDDGTREVQIKRRAGDIHSVIYTMNDEEVINNLQPFALTEKELPLYNLTHGGKTRAAEKRGRAVPRL